MVSSNEADLDLRGMVAPVSIPCPMGQSVSEKRLEGSFPIRGSLPAYSYPKDDMENLIYPMSTEEPAIAGIGQLDNRHLTDLVESITRNLGAPSADGKGSGSRGLETTSENPRCV